MKARFLFFVLPYAALLLLAWLQVQHYWPLLPDRLVTRFGAGGQGFTQSLMTKQAFACFYGLLAVLMPLLMVGGTLLMRILPLRFINLPNKHYWLAPERRQQTLARMESSITLFALFIEAFIIALHQLVIQANLVTPPQLNNPLFFALFGTFFAITLGFIFLKYRQLRLPAGAQDNNRKP